MVITYHGGQCFKVSRGDLTVALNPPSKDSKFKIPKFGADIALTSLHHPDFDGFDTASLGERQPFAIEGPGEYDVKGVAVRGWASEAKYDGVRLNTIYSILLENTALCFLGALGSAELPKNAKSDLDGIDILFVPIGGNGLLDYSGAYKLAVQLEPKVIIPMHYTEDSLRHFLKEAGAEGTKPVDRLTIKKKDLEGKEAEIVVLSEN